MRNNAYTFADIEAASAPNMDLVDGSIRPLGSCEHLFWLLDQGSPMHFSLAAQIEGETTVGEWRAALDRVQRRHPFFSVWIDKNGNGNPCFSLVPETPIPIRVVRSDSQPSWLTEMERELAVPFDAERAPLVRAVLMHEPHRATLILTAHHSIADGLSLSFAIRDTLLAISGRPIDPLPVTPSMESMFDSAESGPIGNASNVDESEGMKPSVLLPQDGAKPRIRALRLSSELTARLRERARQEDTTVHGALCAALVLAGSQVFTEWKETPVRVLSPIDARKLLGVGEDCGLFVSARTVSFQPDGHRAFWELARFAKSSLSGAQTRDGVTPLIHAIRQSVSSGLDVRSAWQFAAHGFAHEATLTNLGNLRYESSFGRVKLEALWGPGIIGRVDGEQTIGVVTVNGSLHLLHTSHTPASFLLEVIEQELLSACR
jgi:hypothetical protein